MSDDISRDPNFRDQYAGPVIADPQFEAALSGSPQPRVSMPVVSQPLPGVAWLSPLHRG